MNYDSEPETREHILQVAARLETVCRELRGRGERHDASKLSEKEKPLYDIVSPKLSKGVYGSEEYHRVVVDLGPALEHHPEHYENGVSGMDLLDLVEMYCD